MSDWRAVLIEKLKHLGPGVFHANVAHDTWCPMSKDPAATCICQPEINIVNEHGSVVWASDSQKMT